MLSLSVHNHTLLQPVHEIIDLPSCIANEDCFLMVVAPGGGYPNIAAFRSWRPTKQRPPFAAIGYHFGQIKRHLSRYL